MKSRLVILFVFVSLKLIAQGNQFKELTTSTKIVSERYFEQYAKLGFDSMAMDMSENYNFEDPTAKVIFNGLNIEGKDKAIANFKANYTFFNVSIPTIRRYFSGNYGIFEGTYKFSTYTPKKEVISFELPITIIIKVENGKVVEHRDFADYQAYLSQYQKEMARLRAKASGGGR